MSATAPTRVLVVANRTAATPRLLDEIARRARSGACDFSLLVPARKAPDWSVEDAASLLAKAAHRPVDGRATADALAAVREAVAAGDVDEVVVSVRPGRAARALHRDLARRIERFGVPVTPIAPSLPRVSREDIVEDMGRFNAGGV